MLDPIRIFIGFDPREAAAFHVCCQSIITRASEPVQITPLALNTFRGSYEETHGDGSNAFIYSRFLVPWLCGYNGYAIYLDGDMIVREDVARLWAYRRPYNGASVVKHDYRTKHPRKYFGASNEDYPRKNWSSVILWNCGFYPNRKLTPKFVREQSGSFLHRFSWLADDQIDGLSADWNHLTMEYAPDESAKLLHFTLGTPCITGYGEQEGAAEWWAEFAKAIEPVRL